MKSDEPMVTSTNASGSHISATVEPRDFVYVPPVYFLIYELGLFV